MQIPDFCFGSKAPYCSPFYMKRVSHLRRDVAVTLEIAISGIFCSSRNPLSYHNPVLNIRDLQITPCQPNLAFHLFCL
jgi:hypothetical protein